MQDNLLTILIATSLLCTNASIYCLNKIHQKDINSLERRINILENKDSMTSQIHFKRSPKNVDLENKE